MSEIFYSLWAFCSKWVEPFFGPKTTSFN